MTFTYVTRAQLGWGPSQAPTQTDPVLGLKIHYEGTPVPVKDHSYCDDRWKAIRASHLANTAEGYSDVAYNWAVCNHGIVFEGRGWGKRTGANGTASLNRTHNAILWMGGTSGVVTPSAVAVESIKGLIHYLRSKGAGKEIKGHRDGYATSCPGDPMYSLVKSGKLEPTVVAPTPPKEVPDVNPVEQNQLEYVYNTVSALYKGRALAPWTYKGLNETKDAYWYLRESKAKVDALSVKLAAVEKKLDALIAKLG